MRRQAVEYNIVHCVIRSGQRPDVDKRKFKKLTKNYVNKHNPALSGNKTLDTKFNPLGLFGFEFFLEHIFSWEVVYFGNFYSESFSFRSLLLWNFYILLR